MRYVHLYFTCIKRSMISRLEYKKDTIVALFSFFFSNFCSLTAIYFILQAIPALAGYSLYEVGFFYGFSMLPIASTVPPLMLSCASLPSPLSKMLLRLFSGPSTRVTPPEMRMERLLSIASPAALR